MAGKRKQEMIISKEEAVFGLDERGRWQHKEHGRFENPRVIAHFHSCIRKDGRGYYLEQEHPGFIEKVYFEYEDTALFVFDVEIGSRGITLILNTGRREPLRPRHLYIENDVLYSMLEGERVRFAEQALVRMADLLEFDEGGKVTVRAGGTRYPIEERPALDSK